jgi:hypothetical protein
MDQFAVTLHGDDVCFVLRPTTSEKSSGDSGSCIKLNSTTRKSALSLEFYGNLLHLAVEYDSLISQMKGSPSLNFGNNLGRHLGKQLLLI